MAQYTQLNASGFPVSLVGNRYGAPTANKLVGDNLIAAIEANMPAMLLAAAVGNVAGYQILKATTRWAPQAFPPASQSITWGNLTNADRQCGGGIITEVETSGMPLANGRTTQHKTITLFFAGTADDVPGGIYQHEIRSRNAA